LSRPTLLRRWQSHLKKPRAQWALSGYERRTAGGAGLLTVVVREDRAFRGDAVDVGGAVAHHAAVVGADIPVTDVVSHDDEDVGFWLRAGSGGDHCGGKYAQRMKTYFSKIAHAQCPN